MQRWKGESDMLHSRYASSILCGKYVLTTIALFALLSRDGATNRIRRGSFAVPLRPLLIQSRSSSVFWIGSSKYTPQTRAFFFSRTAYLRTGNVLQQGPAF